MALSLFRLTAGPSTASLGYVKIGVLSSVAAVALLSAGCIMNPRYLPGQYSFSRLKAPDQDFVLRIDYEKLQQIGGPNGAELHSLVTSEVQKAGICSNGYRIVQDGAASGYVYFVGKCKAST
jgi:hypothetical protein